LSRRTGRPILAEFLCRRKRNGGNNAERSFFKAVTLDRLAPDESAKAAIFLASDYTSYIKGTELLVDGDKAVDAVSNLGTTSRTLRYSEFLRICCRHQELKGCAGAVVRYGP
jgi:hypothetical protein